MRKRTYLLWKKLLVRLTVLFAVIFALYVYLRTGTFTIHSYDIQGAPAQYVDGLRTEFGYVSEQKIMHVLPSNRVISYHDDELRTTIMETLPNTKRIRIHPSGLHTLSIQLEQYEPLFAVGDQYAISKEGVVYKEIVPLVGFPKLEIASTTEVSPAVLAKLSSFTGNVSTVLFPVRTISIDEYDDVRLFDEDKKSFILLSSHGDMDKQWSNILSAIDTEPLKGKIARGESLQYLDARFGNKVFYKFTNNSQTAIIPPPETNDVATTTVR